ncbi:YbjQ family protein [Teredinibacter turnerae]|uniref:YbjQ family protein n=1 Tax=Teredinibacter turnerae TaxID=2426 RepID=UPI000362E5B1|nr:YbjQ family protein [Teredinibacter turnerae]
MSKAVLIPVLTTETVPGREIECALGIVRGNTIRARHLGNDILAGLRSLIGGEITEYTKLIAESREQALERMLVEARELGADAVINLRFTTSTLAAGAAELLAYGTAVKLRAVE